MTETFRLQTGDTAPAFTLLDQDGSPVSLADYTGRRVIVYFYPEAMTPGCTTQACDFRDNLGSLASAGYQVLGISKDAVAKLKMFQEEDSISFPLLSDEDLAVHVAYGTWGEKNSYGRIVTGTLRSTFVIDEAGVISHALYNVKATGHISMLRRKLGID
ncbi:thioredoxin-dependent thiol peroxidase [Leifsonia sp. YIM 134122]|uniref:thioredoxin-dependent peroxiredoxin n=1 Tax=Leifsonia stereocauli TaxID=3134136 RepID=A0ABU9W3F1_9MICO